MKRLAVGVAALATLAGACGGGSSSKELTTDQVRQRFGGAIGCSDWTEENAASVQAMATEECDGWSFVVYKSTSAREDHKNLYELIPTPVVAEANWVLTGPDEDQLKEAAEAVRG